MTDDQGMPTHRHSTDRREMKRNTVIETAVQSEHVQPPDRLIPLAALAAEGFGWESGHVRTPRDAINALARRLAGLVELDDVGRRCVARDTARRLLAERAAAEERQRARRQRRAEEWARRPRPVRGGVHPIEGLTALQTMTADPGEDQRRKDMAAEKAAALLRGESIGARFTIGPEE